MLSDLLTTLFKQQLCILTNTILNHNLDHLCERLPIFLGPIIRQIIGEPQHILIIIVFERNPKVVHVETHRLINNNAFNFSEF